MLKPVGYFLYLLTAIFCLNVAHGQAGAGYDTTFATGVYGSGGKTGAAGVFLGFYDIGSVRKIVHSGAMLDLGLIGPMPKKSVDGIFSINYLTTYKMRSNPSSKQAFPFATVGYSRFFASGNAVNYGAGILWRYRHDRDSGLRFEFRDNWIPGAEHMPSFRVSFETVLTDD